MSTSPELDYCLRKADASFVSSFASLGFGALDTVLVWIPEVIPSSVEVLVDYRCPVLNRPTVRKYFQVNASVGPDPGHYGSHAIVIVITFGNLIAWIWDENY